MTNAFPGGGSSSPFAMVKEFFSGLPDEINCTGYYPDAPTVPVAQFSGVLGIDPPELSDYVYVTVPTDGTIDVSLYTPTYTGSHTDIAAITLDSVVSAIEGVYSLPPTLPEDSAGAPPLDYPVAGFGGVPTSAGLTTHTAPSITVGTVPGFLDIPEVTYDLSGIEPLAESIPTLPTITGPELLGSPEQLAHTVSAELDAEIHNAFLGRVVLPGEAQQIMLARAAREHELVQDRKERALFTKVAAEGHFSVPGGAIAALSDMQYDGSYKDREVYETVRSEVYKRATDRMLEALSSVLTLESANLAMHLDYCAKLTETLRVNVALQVEYANVLIGAFNSAVRAAKLLVAAYNDYVKAVLSENSALAAVVRRDNAILDTNMAKVGAYEAQQGTIEAQAGLYENGIRQAILPLKEHQIHVSGVLKNIDIARINLDSLKESIRAHDGAVDVLSEKFSGYAAEVRATGSATGVYEANWDAYSAAHSVAETLSEARRNWYTSSTQALRSSMEEFQTASQAQRDLVRTLSEWAQANTTMAGQHERTYREVADYTKQHNAQVLSREEAESNIDLAEKDVLVRMDALEAQAVALQESINVGLQSAETMSAAGCAQSAYSMRSFTAAMRATADKSETASQASRATQSASTTKSYVYRKTRSISA